MKNIFVFALFGLILIMETYAQSKNFNINDTISLSLKSAEFAEKFDVSVKNARPFVLNSMLWNHSNVAVGDTLQLSLFPGKEYLSVIQSKTIDVNGTTVLVAKLVGFQFAWCFISLTDQVALVMVDIPERKEKYTTRFHPQRSSQYLVQLDEDKLDILIDGQMPISGDNALDISNLPNESERNILNDNKTRQENIGLKSAQISQIISDSAQIDILVVYTPAAKLWADTYEGGINNTISQAIAKCNLVSENSKLGIKFNLVHSTEVDYKETGNSEQDLMNLTDGISNTYTLRDVLAADVVLLLTQTDDMGGISWPLVDRNGNDNNGYFIVRVGQASGLATLHEIGHIFGAQHHKEQSYQPGPTAWDNWPENTWTAGWRWKGIDNNYYCDVMTYGEGSYFSDGITHTQVPYFSDPEINIQGQPTGHSKDANNARTIRETKHVVAAYRIAQPKNTITLYTAVVSGITKDGAVSGGVVINEGESKVTARGIVLSTNRMPTLNDKHTVDGLGKGSFTSELTSLVINTTYYVRAYATNDTGTTYGNQVVFIYTGGEQRDFITRWELPSGQDKLRLLLNRNGEVSYAWETIPAGQSGYGAFSMGNGPVEIAHLPAGKTIRLNIAPNNLKGFYNYVSGYTFELKGPDVENLVDVEQWGTARWSSMKNAFYGCKRLNITATDSPNLLSVVDMSGMFWGCKALNGPKNINDWNVMMVRKMKSMFCESSFNQNIGKWDLSSVTDLSWMFQDASAFNQDIGEWDVSKIVNMQGLFSAANTFNKDIGKWDVSSVTNMSLMFRDASAFNQNIGGWDVSNVKNMLGMFSYASAFNQDIGKWDVSSVTDMSWMFNGAEVFNQTIGNWDVSNVKNMAGMFGNATEFNQDIRSWDVSSVTDMSWMFNVARAFNQDIGNWNVSKVTNMMKMFSNADVFNKDIGRWNVSNVTDMWSMFENAYSFNQKIDKWSISRISNLENIFNACGLDCSNYSAILIGWSNISNLNSNIRLGANNREYGINAECARSALIRNGWIIIGDAPNGSVCGVQSSSMIYTTKVIPTSSVTASAEGMICSGVSGITSCGFVWSTSEEPTVENNLGIKIIGTSTDNFESEITGLTPNTHYYIRAFFRTNSVTTYGSQANFITFTKGSADDFLTQWKLPADQTTLKFYCERSGDVRYTWETAPAGQSGEGTFTVGNEPVVITGLPSGQTISLRIAPDNFKRIYNPSFNYNLSPDHEKLMLIEQWGTTQWTSMENAFWGCKYLQIIATDIPNLAHVVSMKDMFYMCSVLNGPSNINDWDVSKITDMSGMFKDASSFNQNIGGWNTSSVIDMMLMFRYAKAFNQDIGNWNVSRVTNMGFMFSEASSFNQDIGNWNVSKVTNMYSIFSEAKSFNQDIGDWDVSSGRDMGSAFAGAVAFNKYIGNWDVSSVKDMSYMFYNAPAFNQNIGQWNLASVTNMTNMLDNSGMDCFNYSATLSGWSANITTPDNLKLGAQGLGFGNNAKDARINLTTNKKWTITGDAATGATCDIKTNVIGNNVNTSKLKIYPNPVDNELTIEIEGNSCETDLEITNAIGQTVYKGNIANQITIQTGSFAPGMYLIRFGNNKILEFKKIIKK